MYFLKLVLFIVASSATVYLFIQVLHNKIRLHGIRVSLQKDALIKKSESVIWLTIRYILFWPMPVTKYKDVENRDHKQVRKRINNSLLALLLSFIAFGLINITIG